MKTLCEYQLTTTTSNQEDQQNNSRVPTDVPEGLPPQCDHGHHRRGCSRPRGGDSEILNTMLKQHHAASLRSIYSTKTIQRGRIYIFSRIIET